MSLYCNDSFLSKLPHCFAMVKIVEDAFIENITCWLLGEIPMVQILIHENLLRARRK